MRDSDLSVTEKRPQTLISASICSLNGSQFNPFMGTVGIGEVDYR